MKRTQIPTVNSHRRRGFTLTELAIVLGIMGVVIGAIWTAAASVSNNRKVAQAVSEIYYIVANVRSLYGYNLSPPGLTTTNFLSSNIFPQEMLNGGVPQNPWGTTHSNADITGAGVSVGNPGWGTQCYVGANTASNVVEVVLWGVPKSACANILSQFVGPGAGSDVLCVYSDGAGAFLSPSTTSVSTLLTQSSGCTDGYNIVIYFRL